MIGMNTLIDKQWYDGFLWYDGRQKSVATLYWHKDECLFKSDTDARVYPHVAEPRTSRVYCFEPNVKGAKPDGEGEKGTRTATKAS